MVTYCIGSARQKREYFKGMKDAVVLDNVEVLFCASENGRNYFAYGDIPFGGFTVAQYLAYSRALDDVKPSETDMRELGCPPNKKLKKLSEAQLRAVMFLEQTAGRTDRTVVVNLDGAKYTRKNIRALEILLSRVKDAYVCVTDKRFAKKAKGEFRTVSFGKRVKSPRPKFYSAKALARKIGATRISSM